MPEIAQGDEALTDAVASLISGAAGLPEPVARGLLPSIFRLVGGFAGYPAAWMHRFTQGVEDRTAALTHIRTELSIAATQQAISDPLIVDRAMWSLLGSGVQKQINREKVADAAIKDFVHDSEVNKDPEATEEPEEDWMNGFSRFAEDASSERMQQLLGKVLAGENRRSGSYSLSTIRILAELDPDVAKMFQEFCGELILDFVPRNEDEIRGPRFEMLAAFEALGLLKGMDGLLKKEWGTDETGVTKILFDDIYVVIDGLPQPRPSSAVLLFTRAGRQIASLFPKSDIRPRLESWLIKDFGRPPFSSVSTARVTMPADEKGNFVHERLKVLWELPKSTQSFERRL